MWWGTLMKVHLTWWRTTLMRVYLMKDHVMRLRDILMSHSAMRLHLMRDHPDGRPRDVQVQCSGLLGTGSPRVTQYRVGLDYYWRLSCTRYCRVVFSCYFACQPDCKRTPWWPSRRFHQARVVTANSLGQIGAASGHKSLLSTKRIGGIVSSTDLIAWFTLSDHLDSDSNTPRVSN